MEGKADTKKPGTALKRSPKLARSDQLTQPIHNQIAALLRKRIVSGEYTEDTGLPPEWTLADHFKVSRHTVRAALQKLVSDGLIERRRGMRTTIKPYDATDTSWVVDSLESIIGEFSSADLISAELAPAKDHPEMMKLFALGRQDMLFKVVRVLKSEAGPYAYSTIFTRSEFGTRVPKRLINKGTFVKLIEEFCKVRAAKVRQSSSAALGSKEATKALDIAADSPMLRLRRLFLTQSGEPISHSEMFCRSDRYTPVVVFARDADTTDKR